MTLNLYRLVTMFSDEAKIHIKAGDGGEGRVSFLHEKGREFGGPDGGDGGEGGSIIFKVNPNLNTLYYFKSHKVLKAKNGEGGKKRKKHGKSGEDLFLEVPQGTVITDAKGEILADLDSASAEAVAAHGGKGGYGNAHFVSSVRQAPKVAELGEKGEEKDIVLELKLVADVGLIGLPNAGKSMLLSVISKARPKVASYPFTTIIPNLGVVEGERFGLSEGEGFVACDIPGLIEDASKGKGLGDEFLRHVERTRLLVHLIDITSEDVAADFKTIQKELYDYKKEVAEKPQLVILTKSDLIDAKMRQRKIKELKKLMGQKKFGQIINKEPFVISAVSHEGLKELILEIHKNLKELPAKEIEADETYKIFTIEDVKGKGGFAVKKVGEVFEVSGEKIERFAERTDFSNKHAVYRLKDIMKKMGIEKELIRKGVKEGDKVRIEKKEMAY